MPILCFVVSYPIRFRFSFLLLVVGVKLLPPKDGIPTRSAFVDFELLEHAKEAHNSINEIGGQEVRTDFNNKNAPRRDGGGGFRYGEGDFCQAFVAVVVVSIWMRLAGFDATVKKEHLLSGWK